MKPRWATLDTLVTIANVILLVFIVCLIAYAAGIGDGKTEILQTYSCEKAQ